jgi:hypothetical protein
VLFNRARRVEPYDLPEGTEVDLDWAREDDDDDAITIFEKVPPEKPKETREPNKFDLFLSIATRNYWEIERAYQLKREEGDDDLEYLDTTLSLDFNPPVSVPGPPIPN